MATSVVTIADLHVGSEVGLCPPGLRPGGLNPVQKGLWKLYSGLAKEWRRPDWLVVLGDAQDGKARRERGFGQWTTSFVSQTDAAAESIDLWNARHKAVLIGSAYHVDDAGELAEEALGRAVGSEHPGDGWEPYLAHTGMDLDLQFGDMAMHLMHHLSYTSIYQYRSSGITREMALMRLSEKLIDPRDAMAEDMEAQPRRDYLVRAHVHYFWHVEASHQHGFVLPAWQAMTPYIKRRSVSNAPDVGAVRFTIGKKERHYEKRVWPVRTVQQTPRIVVWK